MEYSFEKLTDKIYVCASTNHRFGTDAFLLTHFSNYRRKDKVCDLGTGCGIIPLLMQRKMPPQITYAVDIQADAIEQLKLGIEKSEVENIVPINADLKELWDNAPLGQLDLVTCNPPYKASGAGILSSGDRDIVARHETMCTLEQVISVGSSLLRSSGSLCICQRPERLADIICLMRQYKVEPKRLRTVSKKQGEEPWLILVEGKRDSKSGMRVMPPLFVYDEKGNYSPEMLKIYGPYKEEHL